MTPGRCKEQKEICDKEFVKKLWLLTYVIIVMAGLGGTIWATSAWQKSTELRLDKVEADLSEAKKANAIIDSIWFKVKEVK